MLVADALSQDWPQEPDLRQRVVHWRWFEPTFRDVLERAATRRGWRGRLNDDAVCQAFFAWVHALDTHEALEARDPLDYRHVMAGLLLQQLMAAQQPAAGTDPLVSIQVGEGSSNPPDGAATLITSLVLGLLQALRLQMDAPTLSIDAALPHYWNSYLENVAQDPAMAICYLDRMTGLAPMWNTPTLIGERPAMRAAMAQTGVS